MDDDKSESAQAKERVYDSLGIALLITFPFAFVWGAVLWDEYSSFPLVGSVAGTYAVAFVVTHLWRRS